MTNQRSIWSPFVTFRVDLFSNGSWIHGNLEYNSIDEAIANIGQNDLNTKRVLEINHTVVEVRPVPPRESTRLPR